MEPTPSQLNQLAKDWNNLLQNKVIFEFNQALKNINP